MNAMLPVDLDQVDVMPILPSLNLKQTADFYTKSLGFKVVESCFEDYVIVRRGRIELHFWRCSDPQFATNSSVLLRSDHVERLYDEFQRRGVDGLIKVREDQKRLVSFHIRDPHGNMLLFTHTNIGDYRD